jgi:acetyl-CoA carboxylase carboxyltransferase component
MHSSESGVTDHLARDDSHALAIARSIVADLGNAGRRPAPVCDDSAQLALHVKIVNNDMFAAPQAIR